MSSVTNSNPYQTPKTINPESDVHKASNLASMESKALKKLYHRSLNISTIAVLLVISVLATYTITFWNTQNNLSTDTPTYLNFLFIIIPSIFSALAAIGLFMRTSWGRIIGMIACALMTLKLPLGTIFGIVGLVALAKAPELFGPNRITHADVKREYKARKRQKRLQ